MQPRRIDVGRHRKDAISSALGIPTTSGVNLARERESHICSASPADIWVFLVYDEGASLATDPSG